MTLSGGEVLANGLDTEHPASTVSALIVTLFVTVRLPEGTFAGRQELTRNRRSALSLPVKSALRLLRSCVAKD